jgi:hypothetical protein
VKISKGGLGFQNFGYDFRRIGEIFEGDSGLHTCEPENFRWCRWGDEQRVSPVQTWKQGPPLAPAEFIFALVRLFYGNNLSSPPEYTYIVSLIRI